MVWVDANCYEIAHCGIGCLRDVAPLTEPIAKITPAPRLRLTREYGSGHAHARCGCFADAMKAQWAAASPGSTAMSTISRQSEDMALGLRRISAK